MNGSLRLDEGRGGDLRNSPLDGNRALRTGGDSDRRRDRRQSAECRHGLRRSPCSGARAVSAEVDSGSAAEKAAKAMEESVFCDPGMTENALQLQLNAG